MCFVCFVVQQELAFAFCHFAFRGRAVVLAFPADGMVSGAAGVFGDEHVGFYLAESCRRVGMCIADHGGTSMVWRRLESAGASL